MNQYNPKIHHRKSIRLKGYDYSQEGLYFITICCKNNECFLGEIPLNTPKIDDDIIILNDAGRMIEKEWLALRNRFPNIELHEFVVMPNHFHGILEITGANPCGQLQEGELPQEEGQPREFAHTNKTVGDMMDAFKSITTVEYIRGVRTMKWKPFDGKIWHRNYYENIIRSNESEQNIANYILNNPAKWRDDRFFRDDK